MKWIIASCNEDVYAESSLKDCNVAWQAFLGLFFYYCRIHRIQGA